MAASTTLSIRIPFETRRWLDRFAKRRGSAGSAAVRVLEEARLREEFPAIEFRDTPLGRVAFIHGTRVQAAWIHRDLLRDPGCTAQTVAAAYDWPVWKAASALEYVRAHAGEMERELEDLESADFDSLKRLLPALERMNIEAV